MTALIEVLIIEAEQKKPKFGDDCNHCGWCCLTEVCEVGQILGGKKDSIPCDLLRKQPDGRMLCSVAEEWGEMIGAGTGCCAETQKERLAALGVN